MMHALRQQLLLASLAFLSFGAPGYAENRTGHPVVPGFERFATGDKADTPRGGQLLLGELNCLSCHGSGEKAFTRKQAPLLDNVAARVRLGYLKKYLSDPQAIKPGSTMPNVFSDDPDKAQKVEALVHFLATTGALKQDRPDLKAATLGRELYQSVGCIACHGTRKANGNPELVLPTSVPLGDLKSKYLLFSLARFLEEPRHVRPAGRMPKLLNAKEAKEVANFLLQGIDVALTSGKGSTMFKYYEGTWDKLPDFTKLKPLATGIAPGFDVSVARRGDNYGMLFTGFFKVERDGDYAFTLASDDGARLSVDGKMVVDNDGTHPPKSEKGRIKLTTGVHQVAVAFFQAGGGAELDVHIESPGTGQHNLGELTAATEAALDRKPMPKATADEDELVVQPDLVAKGKLLFASAGCANCHQLNDVRPRAAELTTPALDKLQGKGGCLASTPRKGVPWYALSTAQREALTSALKSPPPPAKTPAEIIVQTFTTFNCYACHVRATVGGPEEALNKFFLTTQPEMGDEGRVPPPLDGVGAKLSSPYLQQLLDQGAHDRPYMHTRMPAFGGPNVGHLAEALAAPDKLPEIPRVVFASPEARVKASARHLVGGQAFGCIKCHTFAGHKAEGVQGIDMLLMPRRLTRDWFHAYINDPQRIRPGTRMPAGFLKGKSVLPEILDGRAVTQIEAMWLYLQEGSKAQLPVGLQKRSIPLVPGTTAILYRNFIQGAGTRAIGVGYPEKVNLAFDANDLRLALLWQGAFMDAARHWHDRGEGFEGPLGDNILHLPAGVSFAVLPDTLRPWPTAAPKELGYRFLGYRLTPDDRPTFLYAFDSLQIEDFPNPVVNGSEMTLRRTLTLKAPGTVDKLYFRAAAAHKIEALADGWYRIDGAWKVKIEHASARELRKTDKATELLVPIVFTNGTAKIVQEFAW